MDASTWISLAALGVTVIGGAAGYGALRQKVASLKESVENETASGKEALTKVESRHTDALIKIDGRVSACEAGHANTSQEMNALRVDVAILTERSGATITSLDRIERHLSDRDRDQQTAAPRRRAAAK